MHTKVTVKSPINIALIKYWGKEDEDLIIPCNSSISITLDTKKFFTETTVTLLPFTSTSDTFVPNGSNHPITKRMQKCLVTLREMLPANSPYSCCSLSINSRNNFPTAAGMASSASGISALVVAIWKLFELDQTVTQKQLTAVARLGSGSACRSIPGGFVRWQKGSVTNSSSSIAEQISGLSDSLRILVYVFSKSEKQTSSSIGMQRTKATSSLFQYRISTVLPSRLQQMEQAIQDKRWSEVFELTMQDSNSMHACCLDSYPPVVYMNEFSHRLVTLVDKFNEQKSTEKRCTVGYSFDAGANGFVFLMDEDVEEWKAFVGNQLEIEAVECKMGNGTEVVSVD